MLVLLVVFALVGCGSSYSNSRNYEDEWKIQDFDYSFLGDDSKNSETNNDKYTDREVNTNKDVNSDRDTDFDRDIDFDKDANVGVDGEVDNDRDTNVDSNVNIDEDRSVLLPSVGYTTVETSGGANGVYVKGSTPENPAKIGDFVVMYDLNAKTNEMSPIYVRVDRVIRGAEADKMYRLACAQDNYIEYEEHDDNYEYVIFELTLDYTDWDLTKYGEWDTPRFRDITLATAGKIYQWSGNTHTYSQQVNITKYVTGEYPVISERHKVINKIYVAELLWKEAENVIILVGNNYNELKEYSMNYDFYEYVEFNY